jgi:hypothetical protein
MEKNILAKSRLPKKREIDPRDRIFTMNGIELSGTDLEHRIRVLFLQRELNLFVRFEEELESDHIHQAALYCMISKAGSYTVSTVAPCIWNACLFSTPCSRGTSAPRVRFIGFAVVKGIKWLHLLPPTEDNLRVWKDGTCSRHAFARCTNDDALSAEMGEIRADLLCLPDLCANTPVKKQVIFDNQAV